jgi:uncharacterized membrane protein (UPF0127 family)
MDIIESYLDSLSLEESDLFSLLSKFKKVVIFKTIQEINTGLLKYKRISASTAFLFKLTEERVISFHTVNMNFNIDMYFFNYIGKLVSNYKNLKPGIEKISSKSPAKYVVETLSKGVDYGQRSD